MREVPQEEEREQANGDALREEGGLREARKPEGAMHGQRKRRLNGALGGRLRQRTRRWEGR